jgi:hypothetical protein
MQSADGSVASLTADILHRVSSSADLQDSALSIGPRTPLSPHTPVSSSPAAAGLHPAASTLPSPPLFMHWKSVDEMRAQSALDCRFADASRRDRAAGAERAAGNGAGGSLQGARHKRRGSASMARTVSGKSATRLTPLHEEVLPMSPSGDAHAPAAGALVSGGLAHRQPTPPISKCDAPLPVHPRQCLWPPAAHNPLPSLLLKPLAMQD